MTNERPLEGTSHIGLLGLAVMGSNLALNLAEHGFTVAVWNRDTSVMDRFVSEHADSAITGAPDLETLVKTLARPRRLLMMIKAGDPVDQTIDRLRPLLEPGDILMDGGNSWFKDTQRREAELKPAGINYFGIGISGGEKGARLGPSLMPGGDKAAYEHIRPALEAIAAVTESGPCVTYVGPDGAGHFVKMVHNGIEYGDMQLIAEAYDILRRAFRLEPPELAAVFSSWNGTLLESYLIELTAKIFTKVDDETGQFLVDLVLDKAGQKGTGKWTVQSALDLQTPIPTIAAAIDARSLSAMKEERIAAAKLIAGPVMPPLEHDRQAWIERVRDALYAAKICSYAQGMSLIQAGAAEYGWGIDLREMARIWKGGCIIRAAMLDEIMHAYETAPQLKNLLLSGVFAQRLAATQESWRRVLGMAQTLGIPVPAMSASLAYFDSYRTAQLPQNLTQAQRDAFGSHTYERADHPERGAIHTEWLE